MGGNPLGCPPGNPDPTDCESGGYGHGYDARTLPGNAKPTNWQAGRNHNVSWGILVNHGVSGIGPAACTASVAFARADFSNRLQGGYRYSLCPLPKTLGGRLDLTEEVRRPPAFAPLTL